MLVNVVLLKVGAVEKSFFEGKYHYCLPLYVGIDQMTNQNIEFGEKEQWTTVVKVWDDDIQRFGAMKKSLGDLLTVDIRLGCSRDPWCNTYHSTAVVKLKV